MCFSAQRYHCFESSSVYRWADFEFCHISLPLLVPISSRYTGGSMAMTIINLSHWTWWRSGCCTNLSYFYIFCSICKKNGVTKYLCASLAFLHELSDFFEGHGTLTLQSLKEQGVAWLGQPNVIKKRANGLLFKCLVGQSFCTESISRLQIDFLYEMYGTKKTSVLQENA